MSCKGLKGRELRACKIKAGKVKRDSLKTDRIFKNSVPSKNNSIAGMKYIDRSPAGKARGKKFAKENNFEGWKEMKKLEKKQDKKNNSGRPTQRTSSQKKALTKLYNHTNIYNAKNKVRSSKPLAKTQFNKREEYLMSLNKKNKKNKK
jgi:hypothetical protein